MYVLMDQDRSGLAQVVGVRWVASEKGKTIMHLIQQFKLAYETTWEQTAVIMIDIDFVEIKICEIEFPESRVFTVHLPCCESRKVESRS